MGKIKLILKHKYVKIVLLTAVAIISIKPFLFTWNLILANFHLKYNKTEAGKYIINTLSYKPPVYKVFNKYSPAVVEHFLVKSAIYNNDKNRLNLYPGFLPFSALQKQFDDNFYFQHLLGNIDQKKHWQCLDQVSFELLTDPRTNQLTMAIFEKIGSSFDEDFIRNLADFVSWKGNDSLCDYLEAKYSVQQAAVNGVDLNGYNYDDSMTGLEKIMMAKFKLKRNQLGENLIRCPGFTDPGSTKKKWYFSKMAKTDIFSRGSFFMGTDDMGKGNNPVIRLMGFFVSHEPGKAKPRAGVRSRQRIAAQNGFYVFSFDYLTITGSERPSFWLSAGLEKRVPPARKQWKKVIFILNNAFNDYEYIHPLIRMWGTGTLLVDNVFLSKAATQEFSIPEPYVLVIENSAGAH